MARKPISRSLPTLASLHPSFHRFDPRANQSAALLVLLRQTGETVRRERTVPFYPMRAVADFFGVSLGIVARAYERLEAEGLLMLVRGSQTWLQGRKSQPLHAVRGVVGLPVYLPAFLASQDWRALLVALETELRRLHFVADYIFYRAEQEPKPELAERILEHQLDAVIWYVPPPWVHMTLQRLSDAGVRLVLISDGRSQFRHPHYFVEIEHALGDAMRQWRQEGIGSLRVLHPIQTPLSEMIWLTSALQKVGVEYT
ncbi:MAG: GntR family transcriptional regulator, partial [Acidobacteria bacterium]|nr:GntR family transcriptional regulator [Acidobacteriota bacterium]